MNKNDFDEIDEITTDDGELIDNEPRQNFVTSVPMDDDIETERTTQKKSLMPIFVAIGVIVVAGAIALFFIFRGKPQETALVKDNSTKVGVNANVNNANAIDFQSDYQKRYGDNANSSPIVSNNSNSEIATQPNYGTVGNITAPPPAYNGQIYQPLGNNSNSNPVGENSPKSNLGSSSGTSSDNGSKKGETTRVKSSKANTEIVELPKENSVYRNVSAGRNEQGSLYFYDAVDKTQANGAKSNANYKPLVIAANAPVKPTFGTILPVRILGSLHTLGTNGLARMELTRSIEGNWGYIPSGTIFIGRVSGGEADRLFVSMIGYLTDDNRLVPIGGDLQGLDGALGLKGQSKRLGSRWSKVFGELLSTAKNIGSAYLLGRSGGSGTVVNTGQLEGLSESVLNNNAARYVVIPAGANGYVVINELPPAIKANEQFNKPKQITDDELLKMIQTNSDKELEKVIPELSSEGRTIAKRALENEK